MKADKEKLETTVKEKAEEFQKVNNDYNDLKVKYGKLETEIEKDKGAIVEKDK